MDIQPLNITVKRTVINGQMFELMTHEEYAENPSLANQSVGILTDYKDKQIMLPYKGKYNGNTSIPGIYNAGCIDFIVLPEEDVIDQYIPKKIIDFSNTDSIRETLEKSDIIERLKEPWITSPDNITSLAVSKEDKPEMVGLKTAINMKAIDLDKYASRFGDNYPNDKRQLKNNSATLNIIKRFCEKLDMEAILILRDKNPNVPNPMNTEIKVSLTDDSTDLD